MPRFGRQSSHDTPCISAWVRDTATTREGYTCSYGVNTTLCVPGFAPFDTFGGFGGFDASLEPFFGGFAVFMGNLLKKTWAYLTPILNIAHSRIQEL